MGPKGGVRKLGLEIYRQQNPEPKGVDAHDEDCRADDRDDDDADFNEIEREAEQEDKPHHDGKRRPGTTGKGRKHIPHDAFAIEADEHEREHGSPDDDREDHGGHLQGLLDHVTQRSPAEPTSERRQEDGADRTCTRRLGRGREAQQNGTEHDADERDRRQK